MTAELLALAEDEATLRDYIFNGAVDAHRARSALDRILVLARLAAKPADEGVREATIEECAKIAERAANRCVREQIPGDSVATFCAQQIRALSMESKS
jgi:hypothetical protein